MSLKSSATTSLLRQLERLAFRPSSHPPHPRAIATSRCLARHQTLSHYRPASTQRRHLRTSAALHLEAPPPSSTTANTSSADANKAAAQESTGTPSKIYSYEDLVALSESPDPNRIIIDVREASELASTGRIPGAMNVPVTSSPDAFFLPDAEFVDRFGFPRPGAAVEVVFYCKAGVRSRAAARLAAQADPPFAGSVAEFPGSWNEWFAKGGRVERS